MRVKSDYPQDVFKKVPLDTGLTFAPTGSTIPKLSGIDISSKEVILNGWDGHLYVKITSDTNGAKKGQFIRFHDDQLVEFYYGRLLEISDFINE